MHGRDVLEIRFMTAKEEDILSSQTLLKKGIALERMLASVIVDKSVKPEDLLVGDRNALIIAARISGYGAIYETQLVCPSCGERDRLAFDLNNKQIKESEVDDSINLRKLDNGNFETTMPFSKFKIEFKLLDGRDEQYLAKLMSDKRKKEIKRNCFNRSI